MLPRAMLLSFLLYGVVPVHGQPMTIGYLIDGDYEMQNTYLVNLFSRIADSGAVARNATLPKTLQIKSKTFNNSVDLQNCLNTQVCQATLDYQGSISYNSSFQAFPLTALNDKALYLTQFNLQEYVLCGLTMSILWFLTFFALAMWASMVWSRNKFLVKPQRFDVRQTKLYEQRTVGQRFKIFEEDLEDEYPREDIIYGGIKRISNTLTCKLALDNPFGMFFSIVLIGISIVLLIISISYTMANLSVRDGAINTVDQIAMRTQMKSPYTKNLFCFDERFSPIFDQNMYTRDDQIWYKQNSNMLFNYRWPRPSGSLAECIGVLVFESTLLFAKQEKLINRFLTISPVVDIPIQTYSLIVAKKESTFINDLSALLQARTAAGTPQLDQEAILLYDTLKQPKTMPYKLITPNQVNNGFYGQGGLTPILISLNLIIFLGFTISGIVQLFSNTAAQFNIDADERIELAKIRIKRLSQQSMLGGEIEQPVQTVPEVVETEMGDRGTDRKMINDVPS